MKKKVTEWLCQPDNVIVGWGVYTRDLYLVLYLTFQPLPAT